MQSPIQLVIEVGIVEIDLREARIPHFARNKGAQMVMHLPLNPKCVDAATRQGLIQLTS